LDLKPSTIFSVWQRNFDVYKRYFLNRFINSTLYPLLFLFAIGYGLGKFVGRIDGVPYPQFIAPALIASAAMFAASFATTYGTYIRMKFQKTFSAIVVTPASSDDVVVAEVLFGATRALFDAFFIYIITVLFGLSKSPLSLLIIPISFLTGIVFALFGILATCLITNIEQFDYYFTLFISLMFLFSGTFFPITKMAPFFQKLALLLPLTHTINLIRPLFMGRIPEGFWIHLLAHFIYISLLLPPVMILLRRRIIEYD
jgi:lipooligosaccharide transport system permease protein